MGVIRSARRVTNSSAFFHFVLISAGVFEMIAVVKESLDFLVTMGLRKQKQLGDEEKFRLEFFPESGEHLVRRSSYSGR